MGSFDYALQEVRRAFWSGRSQQARAEIAHCSGGGAYAEDEARRERVSARLHRTRGLFVAAAHTTIVLKMVFVEQDGCGTKSTSGQKTVE